MKDIIEKTTSFFKARYHTRQKAVVQDVLNILKEEYPRQICISYIADKVYLTPNYLSRLFKNEMNITIVEYLTGIRIDAAKTLLQNPQHRALDVAKMVGIPNQHYFSTVFKKTTGLTPQQYRTCYEVASRNED